MTMSNVKYHLVKYRFLPDCRRLRDCRACGGSAPIERDPQRTGRPRPIGGQRRPPRTGACGSTNQAWEGVGVWWGTWWWPLSKSGQCRTRELWPRCGGAAWPQSLWHSCWCSHTRWWLSAGELDCTGRERWRLVTNKLTNLDNLDRPISHPFAYLKGKTSGKFSPV